METIINQILENLKIELLEFFNEPEITLKTAEKNLGKIVFKTIREILQAYIQNKDEEIRLAKSERKAAGLTIERRNDKRVVLTTLGQVEYSRTYYKNGTDGGYLYPIDKILEVDSRERITSGISDELVKKAVTESYSKASEEITGGLVSKQTVMNKIRNCKIHIVSPEQKNISVLHIDADEDHVNLQDGRNAIVPLISVYEGITHNGKRGSCDNVFHISEYGLSPDELWEKAYEEIERRYDISKAKIYLHGDGAAWIKKGLEWIPNCNFVLDSYHKNKYLKQLRKGLSAKDGAALENRFRDAIKNGNKEKLVRIQGESVEKYQEAAENIVNISAYLYENFEACSISQKDANAFNGASEPHVSHVLSSRLSSRPMGWSEKTLKCFVPMLAAHEFECVDYDYEEKEEQLKILSKCKIFANSNKNAKIKSNSLGLPNPDIAISNAVEGNSGPTFNAIKQYFWY